MRKTDRTTRRLHQLAPLLLLAAFVLSILAVLLYGARVYSNLTRQNQVVYEERTAAQYLAMRLRQAPSADHISLSDFGDGALCIAEVVGDEMYITRIYCHDGWLWELYGAEEGDFAPEDGEKLMELQGLTFETEDELLRVSMTGSGGELQLLYFRLQAGGEGAYEE